MKYEEMSDQEVNMAVTCIIHDCKDWELSADKASFFNCGIDGNGWYEVKCVDFCNNPVYAWGIIAGYGICLTSPIHDSNNDKWAATWSKDGGKWSFNDAVSVHKNPLRAAMVCFLKMKNEK